MLNNKGAASWYPKYKLKKYNLIENLEENFFKNIYKIRIYRFFNLSKNQNKIEK